MPQVIRQQVVGGLTVKLRQRLPGEDYQTKYAIQTFDEFDSVEHIFNGFGYGDDLDYINRKWNDVVQAVEEAQGLTVL
jgi:hypothetical protein